MLPRVLFVWLTFSFLLLVLGVYSQGEEFELAHAGLSLAFALPVAFAVLRGGLGEAEDKQLGYPSLTFMIVGAWTLSVAPSLIVESEAARYLYHYSGEALTLARVFFFFWCVLFTFACGKPRRHELRAQPSFAHFVACILLAGIFANYLVRAGIFSNYQVTGNKYGLAAGSMASVFRVIGTPLFTLLPPLFFLILRRAPSRASHKLIVLAGFVGSWGLLFILGSRTSLLSAVACCLLLCRNLGLRLRGNVVFGLGMALPAVFILVLVYRSALAASESVVTDVGQYITIASGATSNLNEQRGQDDAIGMLSSNVRGRLFYGQQFCVTVDLWLDEGAAMRGSLLSGIMASVPTLFMSNKNALADNLNFETLLLNSQRFPEIDLAPTPWMQWLYELGILGLVVGALFYAWFVRLIEARLAKTRSFYEVLFWLHMFTCILAPEHTTDWLVLAARSIFADVIIVAVLSKIVAWFGDLGRRETKAAHQLNL